MLKIKAQHTLLLIYILHGLVFLFLRRCHVLLYRTPYITRLLVHLFGSFTAEIVEIELDVLRNNILRFELLLSISAFTVTLGALVTGKNGACVLLVIGQALRLVKEGGSL